MQPNLTQDDIAKAISGGQRTLEAQKGNLYKVDINADPAHYLDWDKPLSEQSQHVQDAVSPLLTVNFAKSNPIGSEIYHGFGPSGYEPAGTATKDMATQALRQAGIPGIKYKDAGSRAADGGTHNYVVFDDSLINNLGPWQP
jgi:hypothetical protein